MKYHLLELLLIKPIFIKMYVKEISYDSCFMENITMLNQISTHYSVYDPKSNVFWTLSHLNKVRFQYMFGQEIMLEGHFLSSLNYKGIMGPQCIVTPGINAGNCLDIKQSLDCRDGNYAEVFKYVEEKKAIIAEKISKSSIINIEEMIKLYKEIGNNGGIIKKR